MDSVTGDVIAPRVFIVPDESPCPVVSGASVKGMLCLSGGKLFVVKDLAGTWECVGDQTA